MRRAMTSYAVAGTLIAALCLCGQPLSFLISPSMRLSTSASLWSQKGIQMEATVEDTTSTGATVVAAALMAGIACLSTRRVRPSTAKGCSSLVTAHDGSSWGVTTEGASSSLVTSGAIPYVHLKRGNDEATVYLLGASVTSYKTSGTEWLAVRADAKFDGSKPISGGLPVCWPQFGPGEIQQHGFARNLSWRLLEEPSEAGAAVLELTDSEESRKIWPHAFRLEYRVELKDGELATNFKVENTSASDFNFQAALHSYYAVSDINTCSITGKLNGATKIDKTKAPPELTKGDSDTINISKFTEEVYKEILPGTVSLIDPAKGQLDIVSGGGWRDVVVWNPYGDVNMGAKNFVCVESAEIASVPLSKGSVWEATMSLKPKK